MPKVSKIKAASTRPGEVTPPKEVLDKYLCTRCGRIFKRQAHNFPTSQSPLFRENGGYLPLCNYCVDDLHRHYREVLGDDGAAMRRICMKFDIYWAPEIYAMVNKQNTSSSRVRTYISKTNLYKYVGKTYDDTIDEEEGAVSSPAQLAAQMVAENAMDADDLNTPVQFGAITQPTVETVDFWGPGFTPDLYFDLNRRYQKWTGDLPQPIDPATEALYKQICISEAQINRGIVAGKSVEAMQKAINDMLGSLNRKPVQTKDDAADAAFDDAPFGVLIKIKENTAPIPKPLDEFKDVDGIVRYVSIWFLGHLCKMLNIRNTYSKLYEDEMARLRVDRPDLDEEDDEGAFNDIFGNTPGDDSA